MIPDIGCIALEALIFNLIIIVFSSYFFINYKIIKLEDNTTLGKSILFFSSTVFFLSSFLLFLLIYAFINSDFSVVNVYMNSSTILPLRYKIAASWSSHEGSMIMWLWFLSLSHFLWYFKNRNYFYSRDGVYINLVFILIILSFALIVYFSSNPFARLINPPEQGLGVSPALQDVALTIHPPILYFGYSLYLILYSVIIAGMLTREINNELFISVRGYSRASLAVLSCGIFLGSWWAYRELGWGGFWFFDPVENISLIPWMFGLLFHHLIWLNNNKSLYLKAALGVCPFIFAVIGTFFVRSGLLNSVHSFSFDPSRGLHILISTAAISLSTYLVFLLAENKEKKLSYKNMRLSELLIYIFSFFSLSAVGFLIIATFFPVFYDYFSSNKIEIAFVYYKYTFIAVMLPVFFLMFLFHIRKTKFSWKFFTKKTTFIAIITIICSILVINLPGSSLAKIFLLLGILLFIAIIYDIFSSNIIFRSIYVSHLAVALFLIAVSLNSMFQQEIDFIGKIGDSITRDAYTVKLVDIKYVKTDNYYRQISEFEINDIKNNLIFFIKPEHRLYEIEKVKTSKPNIHSFLSGDFYAVLNNVHDQEVHATFYYKPAIFWLWCSMVMFVFSFLAYRRK